MKLPMRTSKQKLAMLWFIGSGSLLLLLAIQTLLGKYNSQEQEVWGWFLPNIMPTLSLIVSVFVVDAKRTNGPKETIDRFYFRFVYGLSLVYLMMLATTILIEPFTAYPPLELMTLSSIWLGAFQGLVAASVGIFFSKSEKEEQTKSEVI